MEVRHRHVQLGVVGVDELEELGCAVADVQRDETEIAADAVLLVDDGVADADLGQVAHHRVDIRTPPGVALAAAYDVRVELGFSDKCKSRGWPREARVERRRGQRDLRVARGECGERFDDGRPHAVLGEILLHRLASARAFGADQHPAIERFERSLECGERIVGAAVHLHGWQPANGSVDVDSGLRSGHRDVDARKRLQRSAQLVVRQEELRRRQQRTCLVAAHQSIARLGVLPEAIDGRVDVAVQRDDRVARKIVDECRGRVEEERQVVLDAARRDTCRDVLVQRRLRRIAFEHFAESAAKARTARIVQRELARGQQPHVAHRIQRALRVGVERLDALDLVTEEIETVRERCTHRIEVDQAPANAELARRHHLRHVRVAGERQLRAKRVDVELLALRQEERVRREKRLRCKSIERRLCGDQCNVALAARDSIQRRESLGH